MRFFVLIFLACAFAAPTTTSRASIDNAAERGRVYVNLHTGDGRVLASATSSLFAEHSATEIVLNSMKTSLQSERADASSSSSSSSSSKRSLSNLQRAVLKLERESERNADAFEESMRDMLVRMYTANAGRDLGREHALAAVRGRRNRSRVEALRRAVNSLGLGTLVQKMQGAIVAARQVE